MKSKKIFFKTSLWAFWGIMLFSFDGCRLDLLDTSPNYAVSSENIWNSQNIASQAVAGVYNRLLYDYGISTYPSDLLPTWDTFSSILCYVEGWFPVANGRELMNGTATSNMFYPRYMWGRFYEAIHRANDVIANIDKVPGMSDELKAQYKAECKFLRAFYYYRMNMLWRSVPIYLEPINAVDCTNGRASEQEVWNTILADLNDCINEPNLKNKYASTDSQFGRITKGAAYALRGKVYLWLNDWAKAEQDFKVITSMGYALFPDYKALFKEANERCDEMIFTIQFIAQPSYGTWLHIYFGHRTVLNGEGWTGVTPSIPFVDSHECADGKTFNWDDYIPGYSSMSPAERSVYFLRDNLTEQEITNFTTYGSDMSKYLPEGNEARILSAYANRDPRLSMNIITPYSTFLGGVAGYAQDYTLRWPFRGFNDREPYDMRTDQNHRYYYLCRKFVIEGLEHPSALHSPIDFPVIRYADVLLNLAEALNEQGKTEEAITYVNQVRARVDQQLLNTNSHTAVTGRDNMRERIRNERSWELAFEDHTYFDELRWKTWKDKKFAPGNGAKEMWGTPSNTYTWGGEQFWLWPVPVMERQMNPNLTQNPGWVD